MKITTIWKAPYFSIASVASSCKLSPALTSCDGISRESPCASFLLYFLSVPGCKEKRQRGLTLVAQYCAYRTNCKLNPARRIFCIAGVMQWTVKQFNICLYLLSYYSFIVEAGRKSLQKSSIWMWDEAVLVFQRLVHRNHINIIDLMLFL